jgi:hypothetical protein
MKRVCLGLAAVCCVVLGAAGAGTAAAPAAKTAACRAATRVGPRVLPVWARGGFSDAKPRMPYVLGRTGRIAAILWAEPLQSPPPRDHNNKILWVSRAALTPDSDLRIGAQRMKGAERIGAPVYRRVMGGPGPSIVDLPAAGCWRLTLRWSRSTDTLDVRYVARRA